ncbi:MAG: nucleoside-diphosphate kinase [Nanoarchaeota archaeon]|nr:nucleoside-diphosphate kinase [Nanoarchaeota archaeon]
MIEKTLVLIKPDGVKRGLIGEILKRFEQRGLKLVGMKMVWIDKNFAKKHYSAHVKKGFYKNLEEFITSGPVVAMVIEGIHAVEIVRKIVGSTEPKSAEIGTIRADFAHVSYDYADKKGITIKNLIHASGTSEEAAIEINLWFKPEEIYDYKTAHEEHVF